MSKDPSVYEANLGTCSEISVNWDKLEKACADERNSIWDECSSHSGTIGPSTNLIQTQTVEMLSIEYTCSVDTEFVSMTWYDFCLRYNHNRYCYEYANVMQVYNRLSLKAKSPMIKVLMVPNSNDSNKASAIDNVLRGESMGLWMERRGTVYAPGQSWMPSELLLDQPGKEGYYIFPAQFNSEDDGGRYNFLVQSKITLVSNNVEKTWRGGIYSEIDVALAKMK